MSNFGSTAHADDMHCMFDNEEVSLQVFQAATNLSNHDFFFKVLVSPSVHCLASHCSFPQDFSVLRGWKRDSLMWAVQWRSS